MKTVLIIDDDLVIRENTAEILELSGYKVFTVSNGSEGIAMAEKYLPNIIICDIMMPELDGYETFKILNKNKITRHIPFVFFSVRADNQDIRKGMNLGADDYITKPFMEEDLISVIESRLAKAFTSQNSEIKNKGFNTDDNDRDEIRTLSDLKNLFYKKGDLFKYNKHDIIYTEGDHSNYIYLISKGAVKCHKIDEKGKELVTALYKKDDFFGYTSFVQNIPHKESATAIKDLQLIGIPITEFKNILNTNHKLVIELIELLTDNLFALKEQLLQMAYSTVNRKTASTILKFAEKINRKPDDPIKISRQDLASTAGIAAETFIRALTEFKNVGIVKTVGKNFKVVDIDKLKEIR